MATNPEGIEAGAPQRRFGPAQLLMLVGGLLLLLLLLWFFFLRSDGEEDLAATPVPTPVETGTEEELSEVPTDKDPVETFEVFAPKDPFDPLISAASGGATGGSGGTTTGSTTTGSTTTTNEGGGTTTTTTTTTSGGNGGGGESVGGHRVRVIDVYNDEGEPTAQVQVDGTVYTVAEGDRFAENFQLTSTSGQCATMLFGDDEFTLCEGEEILK